MSDASTLLNDTRASMHRRWMHLQCVPKRDLNSHTPHTPRTRTNPLMKYFTHLYAPDRTTTIGYTMYVETDWDQKSPSRKYRTLCHEHKHIEQYEAVGSGNADEGVTQYLLKYLFLPLPTLYARYRYEWERQAFLESLTASYQVYENKQKTLQKAEDYTTYLLGKAYDYPLRTPNAYKDTLDYFTTNLYTRWNTHTR